MHKKKWEIKKVYIVSALALVFLCCLGVLSFVNYSNGDDTYFLIYCRELGFLEYLQFRYETWSGRVASEAIMHIFFNIDIWFWRFVNAGMLVALPVIMVTLKNKITERKAPFMVLEEQDKTRGFAAGILLGLVFYLLLDIRTFGYSCIWITGSMNYLWSAVCGLAALIVIATGRGHVAGIICGTIATLSSEQVGAVLLAFEIIAIVETAWEKRRPETGLILMTLVSMAGFVVSGMAPGNELRVLDSIEYYMPQFEMLTIGQRGFMLVQWLVSSFANENVLFLVLIWIAGLLLLHEQERKNRVFIIGTGIFLVVALAGWVGVTAVTDIGINLSDMTGTLEQVPTAGDMNFAQWGALLWWLAALVYTFVLLWKVTKGDMIMLLTYLGALASEMILIFSPTMYSSGERVFFLTCAMLMFLVLQLYEKLKKHTLRRAFVGITLVLGVGNFILQAEELLIMLMG